MSIEFIQGWLTANKFTAGEALSKSKIAEINTAYLEARRLTAKTKRGDKTSRTELLDALVTLFNIEEEVKKQAILKEIVGFEANTAPVKIWLRAVTGQDNELDLVIMCHWLWMVKRNMLSLPTVHHIMPVIYGRQGSGKTWALTDMFRPVTKFVSHMNMSALSDPRCFAALEQYYIAFFDELAGIEKTDKNALKRQLSAESNTYRVLGTHANPTVEKRCSFIGASNSPIRQVMNDPTGMRRFWQINSAHSTDREMLKSLDYRALWAGIDERLERGYLTDEYLERVLTQQSKTLTIVDDLLQFSEEHKLIDSELTKEVIGVDLYKAYLIWAAKEGITKKWNLRWLAVRMEDAGLCINTGLGKDRLVTYLVHKDAAIEGQDATKSSNILSLKKV